MMGTDREPDQAPPEPAEVVPGGLTVYKRTPEFDQDTIPGGLLRAHSTKSEVWGRICVTEGKLVYRILDERRQQRKQLLTPASPGVVEPEILHAIEPLGEVKFSVEFLRPSDS